MKSTDATIKGSTLLLVQTEADLGGEGAGGAGGAPLGGGGGGGGGGGPNPPPPPPPWDGLPFSNITGILQKKKTKWFIGVEVE